MRKRIVRLRRSTHSTDLTVEAVSFNVKSVQAYLSILVHVVLAEIVETLRPVSVFASLVRVMMTD